jgi:hypothetical protein
LHWRSRLSGTLPLSRLLGGHLLKHRLLRGQSSAVHMDTLSLATADEPVWDHKNAEEAKDDDVPARDEGPSS